MAYEAFAEILIGIILIVIGARLPIDGRLATYIRLGLVLIGIIVLIIGILGVTAQLPS